MKKIPAAIKTSTAKHSNHNFINLTLIFCNFKMSVIK
jgi:hypothetical protein